MNRNGGIWSGDLSQGVGVEEKKVNVEVEVAGWQKFGHGLRHIFASEQELSELFAQKLS